MKIEEAISELVLFAMFDGNLPSDWKTITGKIFAGLFGVKNPDISSKEAAKIVRNAALSLVAAVTKGGEAPEIIYRTGDLVVALWMADAYGPSTDTGSPESSSTESSS